MRSPDNPRRNGSPGVAIFLSAALFALVHGLNGGFLLELPHRFVGGVVMGWLRHRSGSLVPGFLAHLLNNVLAVAVH